MTSRLLTVAFVIVLGCVVVWRDRRISAADSENITWGASDPTWSPDGQRLGFSMFGSIWEVPADGGEARQISSSPDYHAYPAWSPKGDQIAFVKGTPPAGQMPRVRGTLTLVDVATGREREITTPQLLAGTVAWSPDGMRVAGGVGLDDAGSLLHEVRIADGTITPIQRRSQRGQAGFWTDAAWSAKGELFFTAQRQGPVQVWSIPSGQPPVFVQLPLTSYRREDITQITPMISALPDGSGVVYSATMVNGKGDHELYRIGREGGKPVPLTNTTRDEFTPAVSPDGKRIAHVSNHMGNIDLFVMPITGGDKKHVRLTGLKFKGPSGRVKVRTVDEMGQPTPVRLFVRASDQKAYSPAGSPIFYYSLDPGQQREGFFIARGEEEFPAPAGTLRLVALKGVEYRILERSIEVPANDTATVTIQMERWTNWAQRGWYTGENHFHANYNGSYYQRPKQSLEWLEAEDLNSANMIVANAAGAFVHDKEFFTGRPDPISKPRYILSWGEEYRNSDPLGHMGFINIKKLVPPFYTSVPGSDSSFDFPLNTMAALEARKQGGLVTYMHPTSGVVTDVFDTSLGAKEAPLNAALDALDQFDLLPYGDSAYELWYRLLNSGFRIFPGAGTDVFTNWRGINNIPGGSRAYVEVGGAMNWDRWIARYREGRVFVTNSPLLTFQVNGQPLGSVIPSSAGQTVKLVTEVTSREPLRTVDFIRNGEMIERKEISDSSLTIRLEKEVPMDRSSWFAVRVTGRPSRGITGGIPRAHSGPIWVHVGGKPVLIRQDVELMIRWLNRLWAYLEERNNLGPAENKARARKMFDEALAKYRAKLAQAGG